MRELPHSGNSGTAVAPAACIQNDAVHPWEKE